MSRHIIGITGQAGCGKSTLAACMKREFPSVPGTCVLPFATALRDVVEAIFGSRYETQEQKTATDEWWSQRLKEGVTGRNILQQVGTDVFRHRFHPDIWCFAWERRLPADGLVVVPDVRFENEAKHLRACGGVVIGLKRGGQPASTDPHISERPIPWPLLDGTYTAHSVSELGTLAVWLLRQYAELKPPTLQGLSGTRAETSFS